MAGEGGRMPRPSPMKKVLVQCASSMKEYGQCVARVTPKVEKGVCEKEFLALKACMRTALKQKV